MSKTGPSLLRCPRGYAYAKFNGKKKSFGRYDDPKAHEAFALFKADWLRAGKRLAPPKSEIPPITVTELAESYVTHLRERRDSGWIANNLERHEQGLAMLKELFGLQPASSFSPKRLKEVQKALATATRTKRVDGEDVEELRLCRTEVNYRVWVIKRAFRWAVSEELVPPDVHQGLSAVESLRAGEFGAREGKQRTPVEEEHFFEVLPYLTRPVASLLEVLWWSGARPSEVLGLRPCDINREGKVWEVQLEKHKTAGHGKRRAIFFGPEAQRVLEPLMLRPADRPLFSPAESVREMNQRKSALRKTKLYDSHVARYEREKQQRERVQFAETYDAHSLRRAVARAIASANKDRLAKGESPIPKFSPYQIRHSAATRVRREGGLEMVRCLLGHSSATMSEVYADVDLAKARAIMEKAG